MDTKKVHELLEKVRAEAIPNPLLITALADVAADLLAERDKMKAALHRSLNPPRSFIKAADPR